MSLFAPTVQPTFFNGFPLSPTFSPTTTSDFTDMGEPEMRPSSLVLGIGVGTFVILFFFLVVIAVFLLSFGCLPMQKFMWRTLSLLIFGIIFICLALAPREDQYFIESDELKDYDEAINTRMTITCITAFFSMVAMGILIKHKNEHVELYTIDHDSNTFWQDE